MANGSRHANNALCQSRGAKERKGEEQKFWDGLLKLTLALRGLNDCLRESCESLFWVCGTTNRGGLRRRLELIRPLEGSRVRLKVAKECLQLAQCSVCGLTEM